MQAPPRRPMNLPLRHIDQAQANFGCPRTTSWDCFHALYQKCVLQTIFM